jgi:hypothetical protein
MNLLINKLFFYSFIYISYLPYIINDNIFITNINLEIKSGRFKKLCLDFKE